MPAARLDVPITEAVSADFRAGVMSWRQALGQERKSIATIRAYLTTVRQLADFLLARGMPTAPENITAEHAREYLLAQANPATARLRYFALRQFFAYLVRDGELRKSPLDTVRAMSS